MNNIFSTWNDKNDYKIDLVLCVRVINSEWRTHARNPHRTNRLNSFQWSLVASFCSPNVCALKSTIVAQPDGLQQRYGQCIQASIHVESTQLSVFANPRIRVTHSVLRTLHAGSLFGFCSPTGRGYNASRLRIMFPIVAPNRYIVLMNTSNRKQKTIFSTESQWNEKRN